MGLSVREMDRNERESEIVRCGDVESVACDVEGMASS